MMASYGQIGELAEMVEDLKEQAQRILWFADEMASPELVEKQINDVCGRLDALREDLFITATIQREAQSYS
jgi:hypothetical protein